MLSSSHAVISTGDSVYFVKEGYIPLHCKVSEIDTGLLIQLKPSKWIVSDIHNHTYLTDGSWKEDSVVKYAFGKYGIDVLVNSEHGGASTRDTNGFDFTRDSNGTIVSTPVWRWKTLTEQSWPKVQHRRTQYPSKILLQGVEWNVPSHEHASVGIISDANQPSAISDFEYMFDQNDKDTSRSPLMKKNKTHSDAIEAVKWLQSNYPTTSYFITNHPSHKLKNRIEGFRDFNNAGPDVAFGIEGIPGHQKDPSRGAYEYNARTAAVTALCKTYGGADVIIAKVGGVWDALLGEGRHFWNYTNSDFHDTLGDFWPGEYPKTYVNSELTAQEWLDAMRRGASFSVMGDLIDGLDFIIDDGVKVATMGQTLTSNKTTATVIIRFKSPSVNFNGDRPIVNHIDLICGDVTSKLTDTSSADYKANTNNTTSILKRFTSTDWKTEKGWNVICYIISIDKKKYYRLRGTNVPVNTAGLTDENGNPLIDPEKNNTPAKAWADLWFYSNPIFVQK